MTEGQRGAGLTERQGHGVCAKVDLANRVTAILSKCRG